MVLWFFCYEGADRKYVRPARKVLRKREFGGFSPFLCCLGKWSGLNRISHPHWVKICDDHNVQINLRAKQKYEVLSATGFIPHSILHFSHTSPFCMSLTDTKIRTEIWISFSGFIRSGKIFLQQKCLAMALLSEGGLQLFEQPTYILNARVYVNELMSSFLPFI